MGRPAWRRRRLLPPQHPSKWATPGLSIHLPSQLRACSRRTRRGPGPPITARLDRGPRAPAARPRVLSPAVRREPGPRSRPPRSFHLFFLDPSLPPSQSLLHHPSPRRRAFAGPGEVRSSARVGGGALAGVASRRPPNLRRAARAPSPSPVRPTALGLPATQSFRYTGFDME
ncbi:hypothetical protein VPH35_109149 [Triticum aestivum]